MLYQFFGRLYRTSWKLTCPLKGSISTGRGNSLPTTIFRETLVSFRGSAHQGFIQKLEVLGSMQMMRFVKACHVELPKTYTLLSNRTCLAGKVLHEWRCISPLNTNQWFVNMFPWPFQQKDLLLTYVETWECMLVICTDLGRIRIFKSFHERSCCWLKAAPESRLSWRVIAS